MLRQRQTQPPGQPHNGAEPFQTDRNSSSFPSTSSSSSARATSTATPARPSSGTNGDKAQHAARQPPATEHMASAATSGDMPGHQPEAWSRRNQWIIFAIASGACAAFNGVFAKLTTTELTTTLANGIANFFGLSAAAHVVELVVRCTFFGLNLVFNGVMWTLFTQALARGHSTTQVSIMNTSTNFVITALLGLAIFSESLPPLWWAGASLLVAGNVIIGRKDESKADETGEVAISEAEGGNSSFEPEYHDEESDEEKSDEDVPELGDLDEASR